MTPKGEKVLLSIIAAASVVMAAALVKREFFPRSTAPAAVRPVQVPAWQDVLANSVRAGPASAALTVVVLSDLECPFCARWDGVLRSFVDAHREEVQVAFVHWPLVNIHRHALPAARAAECTIASGKFFEFAHTVYAKRDSLGKKSWGSYARDAGVRDTAAVARCAADERPVARIDAGIAFAQRIGARGTPTVLLNGWMLPNPPTLALLESALAAAKRGESLFD